jgi:pyruvate/2-oxoglutarate dehydrogenase complex dihydrolipoamide dehydrogenase (E3) component
MLRSAEVLETARHGAEYGVLADNVRLDYAAVLARKDEVVPLAVELRRRSNA